MDDQADERLKALKASMKEALGKLTGNDKLEAQGARERSRSGTRRKPASPAKKAAAPRKPKTRQS